MPGTSETGRPATAGRLPRDFLAGLVILGFCAIAYWASFDIDLAPAALAQNVQPATFPRMVLAIITIFTVTMMALGLSHAEQTRKMPKLVMVVTGALMIAFVIAFATLGPLLAMAMFCAVMPVIWGARPSWRLAVYAILVPLAIYLVFDVTLDVSFPPGVIERQLDTIF